MKKLLLAAAFLLGSGFAAAQSCPTYVAPSGGAFVTVADTLHASDGSLANGALTIVWQTFTSADSNLNVASCRQYPVNNGVVNIRLEPNAGSTPSGTFYTVQYAIQGGPTRLTEYWIIPASGPVTIGAIRTTPAPSISFAIQLSQITGGGATNGQCPVWNTSQAQWIPGTCGSGGGSSVGTNTLQKSNGSGGFLSSSCTDNGTNVSCTEPLQTGASPPTLTGGTAGGAAATEGTDPTGQTSVGLLTANASDHHWHFNENNGGVFIIPGLTATITAGHLLAAAGNGIDIVDGGTLGGTSTIASGTAALGTSSISSLACATVVAATATGTATTDSIIWTPNASIKAVTGYAPAAAGGLSVAAYPTANNVNFDVCNWSTGSITPGAVTLNFRVVR